jgi:hypothetical protein
MSGLPWSAPIIDPGLVARAPVQMYVPRLAIFGKFCQRARLVFAYGDDRDAVLLPTIGT